MSPSVPAGAGLALQPLPCVYSISLMTSGIEHLFRSLLASIIRNTDIFYVYNR